MDFPQYLELKFLEWQHEKGGRKTVGEFAEYLGIAQSTASSYMNGKRIPEGETLRYIAIKLGIEVYDVLGLPRPDPDLLYLQSHWHEYSAEKRRKLREQAEKYKP